MKLCLQFIAIIIYRIYKTNTRGICLCHSYMVILLCFMMHGQQRMTQVYRKKDDGRQPEAEENQSVDIIRTKKRRGRE